MTLEDVIEAIRRDDSAHALHRRYCDFWLVVGEMELSASSVWSRRKQAKPRPAAPAPIREAPHIADDKALLTEMAGIDSDAVASPAA